MRVAKVFMKGKAKIVEVLKVETVKFDPRPGWVFVREMEKARAWKNEVFWLHPADTHFEWVREFHV